MKTPNPPIDPVLAKMGRKIGNPTENPLLDEKPKLMARRSDIAEP